MVKLLDRERLTALMEKQEIDAIIAARPPNVLYCTGFYDLSHWILATVESYAVVLRNPMAPPVLIIPTSDVDLVAEQNPQVERLYTYGTFFLETGEQGGRRDPSEETVVSMTGRLRQLAAVKPETSAEEALFRALTELDGSIKRVGIDEQGLSPVRRANLEARFKRHEFVPASYLLTQTRMVKTSEECVRLKGAADVTEQGMMAVIEHLREGMTEIEAQKVFESVLISRCARPGLGTIVFGPHSAFPNGTPSNFQLRSGDIVRFDVGCIWRHYWSDLSRCAIFGEPSQRVMNYNKALIAGQEAAFNVIRPGVTAREVFHQAVQAVRLASIPHYRRHHVGHGIGIEMYEPPLIGPGDDTALEPGMILNIETPYYEPGFAGLGIEDLIVVTDDGYERLTTTERKLYLKG